MKLVDFTKAFDSIHRGKMEQILLTYGLPKETVAAITILYITIRRILDGVRAKNLQATLLFVDFTKAFESIHRGKMEQIQLACGIPTETVAAIMILYRNTKVKVRSLDGDTEYFDIVAGLLQRDTLAPYLFTPKLRGRVKWFQILLSGR